MDTHKILMHVAALVSVCMILATVSAGTPQQVIAQLIRSDTPARAPAIELDVLTTQAPTTYPVSQAIKDEQYKRIIEAFKENDRVAVLVWMNEGYTSAEVLADMPDFKTKYIYNKINSFAGSGTVDTLTQLHEDSRVNYIVRDEQVVGHLLQSRVVIQADAVENTLSITGSGVGVCHLDSGLNYVHPNLAHAYVGGYDFVNSDSDPMDDNGHGTATAGVIASNHTLFRGVAPNANLLVAKVLNATGLGSFSDVAAAIDYCITNKNQYNLTAITMSIGTTQTYNLTANPAFIEPALQAATNANMPIVASAGNAGSLTELSYPAVSPYVISVGSTYDNNMGSLQWTFGNFTCTDATVATDMPTCFTNRAPFLSVFAPGSVVVTTSLSGAMISQSGTSFAAPHVAGTIALMAERNPNLTPTQIKELLISTGTSILDPASNLAFSRINAFNAVSNMPWLEASGPLASNTLITFTLHAPQDTGLSYFLVLSTANSPGIPLPDGRVIPLYPDPLLFPLTLQSPQSIGLQNSIGIVSQTGNQATIYIPNAPGIEAVDIYSAFVTVNTSQTVPFIQTVSNMVTL